MADLFASYKEDDEEEYDTFLARVRACHACKDLPLGPRPILHISSTAHILIASQAPGTKVHETGISFNDASGERLRNWLGIDRATFYDVSRIAIVPLGLCYPGRYERGGDKPPRKECAPLWRQAILEHLPHIKLTLLVGSYIQNYVLGTGSMTQRVKNFRHYMPHYFPLPHPSWRTGIWEKNNPWFSREVLPVLKAQVAHHLGVNP